MASKQKYSMPLDDDIEEDYDHLAARAHFSNPGLALDDNQYDEEVDIDDDTNNNYDEAIDQPLNDSASEQAHHPPRHQQQPPRVVDQNRLQQHQPESYSQHTSNQGTKLATIPGAQGNGNEMAYNPNGFQMQANVPQQMNQ